MVVKVIIDYEKSIWEIGSFEFYSDYDRANATKDFICQELRKKSVYVKGYRKLIAPENAVISTQEDILKVLKNF